MEAATVVHSLTPCSRACILVVEDEFLIRMILSDELRDAGYQVIEANNADEALDVLGAVTPDAIVSDVRMPGSLDGLGLLAVIRDVSPALPVIIMSGHELPEVAIAAGATQFLAKPFRVGVLLDAVRQELGKTS